MLIARVVVFSFNNYEGRKRPSKNNFGETMLELIKAARLRSKDSSLYLYYAPRKSLYYIADLDLKVKMPDGSWKEHIRYTDCFNPKQTYARPLDMFKTERWVVMTTPEAREFLNTGRLPE